MRTAALLLLVPFMALAAPLDPDVITGVIRKHTGALRACYEREQARKPSLSGKLVVSFTIEASGVVSNASIAESTLKNARVEGCVVERFGKMKFPRPLGGGTVEVRYPLLFSPPAD
jgi:TonB family protein